MKETLVFDVARKKFQLLRRATVAIAVGGFVTQVLKYGGSEKRTLPEAGGWSPLNLEDVLSNDLERMEFKEDEVGEECIAPIIQLFPVSEVSAGEAVDTKVIDVDDIPKGPMPAARLTALPRL